ncbi:uncharacterized protein Z519_01739 [Cladophialophora bantiana CBS 173.52]|uniref:Folate receptor-like domain-containing protein n=1 Tax=Cladophialophora bantiana (strain ATCC 10958 / CBS 173.52 / CDC B-1940 / NIH 8579) TaxID=1442370 RepID=A0A0D2I4H0_CLAB1|nr:uncharacterized protein Z519_01739 [Cladophialophora bantiana CBS 173.52]KIW98155.1 hypothetical protein Z519_01739 [Cladophialophora bantiana CBS 173.52]
MIVSRPIITLTALLFPFLAAAYPATGGKQDVPFNITVHSVEPPSHKLQKRYKNKSWDPPYKGKPPAWPSQEDAAFPIPSFERTCVTDARVALWKWRYLCDRAFDESLKTTNPRTRIQFCFHPPPSAELCCDVDGNAKYGQTCLSSPLWPQDEQQAAWCSNDCRLSLGPCIFGEYAEINNPENVCKCQFEKCYIPDEFNWMGINPETDGSGYPGLKVESYLHEVKT